LIIKSTNLNLSLIKKLKSFFSTFFKFVGIFFSTLIIIFILFFYNSGLSKTYSLGEFFNQMNTKVLDRYMGLNFLKMSEYINIYKLRFKALIFKPKLENIYLDISQKTILNLEIQKKIKSESNNFEIPKKYFQMFPATLRHNEEKYKVKIRLKGDRRIHWSKRDERSYKIDIRGNSRLFGLEEFSLQKPLTKNYTYELIFHKLLKYVDLINIKYFLINLHINNENLKAYALEEGFSRELLERQKKPNGPIFSVNEILGEYYPNIDYEIYSKKFWMEKSPKLIENLFLNLNNIKMGSSHINYHFDIDKWAKYFAIVDLTGSYHGSLSKSVKLYYNPLSKKFEPIGYDAHYTKGNFDNFIILDFLQENPKCSWICEQKIWYLKFLKENNEELNSLFLKKYISYLNEFTSDKFLKNFYKINNDDIEKFNLIVYSEKSKADKISWKGIGPFVYDKDILFERAKLIKSRINSVNLDDIRISYYDKNLIFEDNTYSNFPIRALSINCTTKDKEKDYFFAGSMKIKWQNSCKELKFTDYKNNSKKLIIKNNISINYD